MKAIAISIPALLLAAASPVLAQAELSGAEVFKKQCIHCHGPGEDMAGTLQLARTRGEDKALLTERKDLAPEYVAYVVRHGLKAMPPFVPSELTEEQLDALTEYLAR